jgi:hypothetical protein
VNRSRESVARGRGCGLTSPGYTGENVVAYADSSVCLHPLKKNCVFAMLVMRQGGVKKSAQAMGRF